MREWLISKIFRRSSHSEPQLKVRRKPKKALAKLQSRYFTSNDQSVSVDGTYGAPCISHKPPRRSTAAPLYRPPMPPAGPAPLPQASSGSPSTRQSSPAPTPSETTLRSSRWGRRR